MLMIVFKSRLSEEAGEEYYATEDHLRERVRAMAGPDLVEVKHYQAEDGERLAIVWWRNPETLEQWRTDPEHQVAKDKGREHWYSSYELYVAEVLRTSFSNADSAAALATE
jgi:heme-degrading monooxygenase HmoA